MSSHNVRTVDHFVSLPSLRGLFCLMMQLVMLVLWVPIQLFLSLSPSPCVHFGA